MNNSFNIEKISISSLNSAIKDHVSKESTIREQTNEDSWSISVETELHGEDYLLGENVLDLEYKVKGLNNEILH